MLPINKNKLKKILIVDASSHYKILEQIYHLLSRHCILDYYFTNQNNYPYKLMFPSYKKVNVKIAKFKGIFIFLRVLVIGWRYHYINISTGPEHDHYSDFLRILGFYLCSLIYGKKIILTIRNLSPYKKNHNFRNFIRFKAIENIKRFSFETDTMRINFRNNYDLKQKKHFFAVSYDRYPDAISLFKEPTKKYKKNEKKIRIGLLGSISEERRDYDILISALEKIDEMTRNKMELVILGACFEGLKNKVIKRLRKYIKVHFINYVLSEEQFVVEGYSCSFLISPLKKFYGLNKGSGSIGDAIYLQKPLIIPKSFDENYEFEEFCYYFDNKFELYELLKSSISGNLKLQGKPVFEKYKTEKVLKKILFDLKICF